MPSVHQVEDHWIRELLQFVQVPLLHSPDKMLDSPNYSAHYHFLCLQVGSFFYGWPIGWIQAKEVGSKFDSTVRLSF
jgi:hypothetical protein